MSNKKLIKKYLVSDSPLFNGFQKLYKFPNSYGASVIKHAYSYGLELGVIIWDGDDWDLCYDTPITDDILGYLDNKELEKILMDIYELKVQEDA